MVRDPLGRLADAARPLLHPFDDVHVLACCAVLAAFLLTACVVLSARTGLREEA